jgi:hypothetical protein
MKEKKGLNFCDLGEDMIWNWWWFFGALERKKHNPM